MNSEKAIIYDLCNLKLGENITGFDIYDHFRERLIHDTRCKDPVPPEINSNMDIDALKDRNEYLARRFSHAIMLRLLLMGPIGLSKLEEALREEKEIKKYVERIDWNKELLNIKK